LGNALEGLGGAGAGNVEGLAERGELLLVVEVRVIVDGPGGLGAVKEELKGGEGAEGVGERGGFFVFGGEFGHGKELLSVG
jgi:hypothetical protein